MSDNDKISALIEEYKNLLNSGEEISPQAARRMQLALSIDTNREVKIINGRLKKVEAVAEEVKQNPSLLYLLRFNTKKTVAIITVTFVLLSMLYISGIRSFLFSLLGLPPLVP
jgi:hypothetical protein